jgi:hypothetical protein
MRLLVLFLSILLPVSVFAAESLEYLLDDAERFEQELQRMETESQWDAVENVEMDSSELIPDSGEVGEASSARVGEVSEEGMYVRIKIEGVPVDLTDVAKDTWFAPYVRSAAEEGIVSGYRGEDGRPLGLYGPADNVTIEQIAKIALMASGADQSSCGTAMRNAGAAGRWSEEFIRCAEHLQWSVFSDGSVDPLRPATRAEVVVTMLQAFKVEIRSTDAIPFTDVDSSTEFRSAITTAYEDHIVGGYTDAEGNAMGKFGPTDSVNRAETAKIVVLAGEIYGQ